MVKTVASPAVRSTTGRPWCGMSGDAVPTWLQNPSKGMQRAEILVLVGLILLPIGMLLHRYYI